jgi:hypothetical protein
MVVLKHGKIFTGRIIITLIVHILGKRRHDGRIADRVCLNYFITTKSLEINLKDIYSSSEYSFILPIFGFKIFRKFQMKNRWIRNYKVNYDIDEIANLKMLKDVHLIKFIRKIGERILSFDFIEKALKGWQINRISKNPKTHQPGSIIIANDESLIFLPEPQGPIIYEKFKEKLSSLA